MFEIIARLMAERHITQRQLADALGVSQGNVSDWKKGRSKPGRDMTEKIAAYFGVSVDFLLGRTEIPNAESLVDQHKNAVDRWISDSAFSDQERESLRAHYSELLSRYKEIVTALSKYARSERLSALKILGVEADDISKDIARSILPEARSLIECIVSLPLNFCNYESSDTASAASALDEIRETFGVLSERDYETPLSDDERALLHAYRSSDKAGRRIVLGKAEEARISAESNGGSGAAV